MIKEIFKKRKFDLKSDRLGPDCPFSHWKLYFKSMMNKVCQDKFLHFGPNAQFRAGAYAITCSKISLGENVIVRPNTMLFADPRDNEKGKIFIEDNVMMGSGVHIYVSSHRYDDIDKDIFFQGHYEAESVTLKKRMLGGC